MKMKTYLQMKKEMKNEKIRTIQDNKIKREYYD